MIKNQDMQEDEIFALKSPQSTQRSQSSAIPATAYEPAPPLRRRGTRTEHIIRIFTYLPASISSAASILYHNPSAFICVHLRLIFSRKKQEALAR